MKLNSRCYAWVLLVSVFAALNGCNKGTDQQDQGTTTTSTTTTTTPPPTFKFSVNDQCAAVMLIEQLNLVAGQTVEYCNTFDHRIELKFSVPGFLPDGALTLTLEPDSCITYVVDAGVVDGSYSWSLSCEGYTGPGGGGPVIVDNPPPGSP